MREVRGDLLALAAEGAFDAIAHGCNCHCSFGAGIAAAIKRRFPLAYQRDLETVSGDRKKLGTITTAVIGIQETTKTERTQFTLINAYTQFGTSSRDGVPPLDYDALKMCFRTINAAFKGCEVGIPKIGAGLARGDWRRIAAIIEEETPDCSVTLVCLEK